VTPDGIPCFDFSAALTNKPSPFSPGETTLPRTLAFFNPNKVQFTYDLVILGQLNHAPVITSIPVIEAIANHPYAYDVEATDADGDSLTFSLPIGPTNMTINPVTGLVAWSPAAGDIGSRDIRVRVEDGHAALLSSVTVSPSPPRRRTGRRTLLSVPIVSATITSNREVF